MLEQREVNQKTDCVIADYDFVGKIHSEVTEEFNKDISRTFSVAIRVIASKYGAEAYNAIRRGKKSTYYMFRFKTEKDKFAFILKNV